MAFQSKFTVQRGKPTASAIAIAAGSAEAQSDTLSINIDVTKLSKGDALLMVGALEQRIQSGGWPPANATVTPTPTPTPSPAWSVQPSITGTPTEGQTLTGNDGTISNGTVSTRAWLRNGTAISGANGGSYLLVTADVGQNIAYRPTATGAGGSASATSASVGPIAAATPTPTPTPGPTPAPTELVAGDTYDLDLNLAEAYAGGVKPAAAAYAGALTDQRNPGVSAAMTSATGATFVPSAHNGMSGLDFGGKAYSIANAAIPANVFETMSNSTTTFIVVSSRASGTGAVVSWSGASGRIEGSTTDMTTTNTGGVGVASGGSTVKAIPLSAGCHIIDVVSDPTAIVGQTGTGCTRIYVDGICVACVTGTIGGTRGSNDLIIGGVTGAGGSGFQGVLMRLRHYPRALTMKEVYRNARYLAAQYNIPISTKLVVMPGNSLEMGTTGVTAYCMAGSLNLQLGLNTPTNRVAVMNAGIGGIKWAGLITSQLPQILDLCAEFGMANVMMIAGEGHNTLLTGTAAQAVFNTGSTSMVEFARAAVAGGMIPAQMHFRTIFGAYNARGGFQLYPAYCDAVRAVPSTYPDLATINIINVDYDTHVGVAASDPAYATKGGYYGNLALGADGTSSAGNNNDGFDGATCSNTPGSRGDGVHRSARAGFIDGVSGTMSGYPYIAYTFYRAPAAAFLGITL